MGKTPTQGNTSKAHPVHKSAEFRRHLGEQSAKLDSYIAFMGVTAQLGNMSVGHQGAVTPRPRNTLGSCMAENARAPARGDAAMAARQVMELTARVQTCSAVCALCTSPHFGAPVCGACGALLG